MCQNDLDNYGLSSRKRFLRMKLIDTSQSIHKKELLRARTVFSYQDAKRIIKIVTTKKYAKLVYITYFSDFSKKHTSQKI